MKALQKHRNEFRLGLLLGTLALLLSGSARFGDDLHISFYTTTLHFPYLYCSELDLSDSPDHAATMEVYEHFENCNCTDVLDALRDYQARLRLSDWHLYTTIAQISERRYHQPPFRLIFQWYFLRKLGYDAQIFTRKDGAQFLHVANTDADFGFYTVDGHRRYINLTARYHNLSLGEDAIFPSDRLLDPEASRLFQLGIRSLPLLPNPRLTQRELAFKHGKENFRFQVKLNQSHLRMMQDYPNVSQAQYFHLDLSDEASASLLPVMRYWMADRNSTEQVQFLLSFVRTAFFYKDDHAKSGREQPFCAEQTLYHSYSDCEDRSALFFYLIRELVGIPAIVIDFEHHVGVAVALPGARGDYFNYEGTRYFYCEATGPDNHLGIGEMWPEVRQQRARILTHSGEFNQADVN